MTSIVDLPPEGGQMWLLALLGVTVVGNMGTAPHPVVEGSLIVSIIFFNLWCIDLHVLPVVNELLQR